MLKAGRPKLYPRSSTFTATVEEDTYATLAGGMLAEYRKRHPLAHTNDLMRSILDDAVTDYQAGGSKWCDGVPGTAERGQTVKKAVAQRPSRKRLKKQVTSEQVGIARAFGITLRYLRLHIGLTQESLAHESSVDRGYLGELERGRYNPTLETIYRLLPHLKVGFAEFASKFDRTLKSVQKAPRSLGKPTSGGRRPIPRCPA